MAISQAIYRLFFKKLEILAVTSEKATAEDCLLSIVLVDSQIKITFFPHIFEQVIEFSW